MFHALSNAVGKRRRGERCEPDRCSPRLCVFTARPDFKRCRRGGFTLIELLLVLLLIALLASLAAPVVTGSIHRAREATLKENLFVLRKAIDDYYADAGAYPAELDVLVEKRYIRRIPVDPVTEHRDSWFLVRAEDARGQSGIVDVRSGSEEKDGNGVPYKEW